MQTITLTEQATGQVHTGHLPTGWHEVPLGAFVQFQRLQQQEPTIPAFQHAVVALTGLPSSVLAEDESIAAVLSAHLSFYREGLPNTVPLPAFEHEGQVYTQLADLSRLPAAQFEAIVSVLETAQEPSSMRSAAHLLSVLYHPQGQILTEASVRATADSFQRLPMSVAWPAFQLFLETWYQAALNARSLDLAKAQVENSLLLTEHVLSECNAGAKGIIARPIQMLVTRYMQSVRNQLQTLNR